MRQKAIQAKRRKGKNAQKSTILSAIKISPQFFSALSVTNSAQQVV